MAPHLIPTRVVGGGWGISNASDLMQSVDPGMAAF